MKICVYRASSATVDASYFHATERLAKELLEEGVEVVCGAVGLMGRLADTFISGGGKIKGSMLKFMNVVEWAHKGISDRPHPSLKPRAPDESSGNGSRSPNRRVTNPPDELIL